MLHRSIQEFVSYCRLVGFSHRSLQALFIRLNEFTVFLKSQHNASGLSKRSPILIWLLS